MSVLSTAQPLPFWYVDSGLDPLILVPEPTKNFSIRISHMVSSSKYLSIHELDKFILSMHKSVSSRRYYCGECGSDVTDCDVWCGCGHRPEFPIDRYC